MLLPTCIDCNKELKGHRKDIKRCRSCDNKNRWETGVYKNKNMRDRNHPLWKGGKKYYWAHKARRIWEEFWGQKVYPGYCIHHGDGNIKNNHISNLSLQTDASHLRIHNPGKIRWEKHRREQGVA